MHLVIVRNKVEGIAIYGRLFVDGIYFCDTMERLGVEIPCGNFDVCLTYSPKFRKLLPLIKVTGRQGIRFHGGHKPEHSSGCVLLPPNYTQALINKMQGKLCTLCVCTRAL